MRFVATIHVRPKEEVRDPQGESVAGALRALGARVSDVRTGKEIVVRFEAADEAAARAEVGRMGDELLANPVIEEYAAEVEPEEADARHASVVDAARAAGEVPDGQPVRVTWLSHTARTSVGTVRVRALPAHVHRTHDEVFHVLAGTAEFRLGERSVSARAGDVVVVPAGTVHTVRPTSDDCVLSTVFAPWFDAERPDREYVGT